MKGPLAEMLEETHEFERLHFMIDLSHPLPHVPAWRGWVRFRPHRGALGRFYLRPSHFSLGARNTVHRHNTTRRDHRVFN